MAKKGEKKSESIEVRVSHTEKLAFMDACQKAGVTASHAIRDYITDSLKPRYRQRSFISFFVAAGLVTAAVVATAMRTEENGLPTTDKIVMNRFDINGDGVLSDTDIINKSSFDGETIAWLVETADKDGDGKADITELQNLTQFTVQMHGQIPVNSDRKPGENVLVVPANLSEAELEEFMAKAGLQSHLAPDDYNRLIKLIDALRIEGTE